MESLTKTQLVLLTLLISFVTSIATGIMASALLQSAPTNVTQTINRVVERTIEKVSESSGSKVIQVVSEDEKVIDSVEKNNTSLVRIRQADGSGVPIFYSLGVVLSKSGEILAPRIESFNLKGPFVATFYDDSTAPLTLQKEEVQSGIVVFKTSNSIPSGVNVGTFLKNAPKLGQTVILLEGANSTFSLVGRVSNVQLEAGIPRVIETDMQNTKETVGAILIDLSGNILGIRAVDAPNGRTFSFASRLADIAK